MHTRLFALCAVLPLVHLGCSPEDPVQRDAGRSAAASDAGTLDAGPGDAGLADAGPDDAGLADAGQGDAGTGDAGVGDAGLADAGPGDEDLIVPAGDGAPFVPPAPTGEATFHIAPDGDDASGDGSAAAPWATLNHALSMAVPGTIIEVGDGIYAQRAHITVQGTAAAPVVIRSRTGGAHFVGTAVTDASNRDLFFLNGASHVIIHGLHVSDAHRSGIRVSLSDDITIQGCTIHDNGRWGIFSDFSDRTDVLGNHIWGSEVEHGVYLSNSGDDLRIVGNLVHDNAGSGVQINADPRLLRPDLGTTGDGISARCLISRNHIHDNGTRGGAGVNLASVRDSTIANNLLVNNRASGIAMWDDGQPDPAPWGSRDNLVAHNTIVFRPSEGRAAVSFTHASTGNTIAHNLLIGGRGAAIQYTLNALPGTSSGPNVLFSQTRNSVAQEANDAVPFESMAAWQARGYDETSTEGMPTFTDASSGDYQLTPGSLGENAGSTSAISIDYRGHPRSLTPDLGALEDEVGP